MASKDIETHKVLEMMDKTCDLLESIIADNAEDPTIYNYEEALFLISELSEALKLQKVLDTLVMEKGCYLVHNTPDC